MLSTLSLGKQTAGAIGAGLETYSSALKYQATAAAPEIEKSLKKKAEEFSKWATVFGAVTAGIATFSEIYKGVYKNKTSQKMRIASLTLYGTTFLYALGKTAEKFGVYKKIEQRALSSAATKLAASRATAFFTSFPVAMVIISIDIVAAIIALRADAKEKDMWRQWMRHSIWGIEANYDAATERGELNQRIWAPKVVKDNAVLPFEDAHLDIYLLDYSKGTSRLSIKPDLNPMIGHWTDKPPALTKLSEHKQGRFTHFRYKVENPNLFRNEWIYLHIKYQPNIQQEPEVQSTVITQIYTNA